MKKWLNEEKDERRIKENNQMNKRTKNKWPSKKGMNERSLWLKPVYRVSPTLVMSKQHIAEEKIKSSKQNLKSNQPNYQLKYINQI